MPMSESVLPVDDDPDILRTVGEFLEHSAHRFPRGDRRGGRHPAERTRRCACAVRAMQLGAEHAMIKDYGLEG